MIDEKQIKEWVAANVQADLTCKVMPNSTREGLAHDGSPCPCLSCYAVRLRVERRELAQMVLTGADLLKDLEGVEERAEKAERELQEQFMHEGALQNENVSLAISLGQAREQRDAALARNRELEAGMPEALHRLHRKLTAAERERDEMEQRARAYQAGASNLQEKRDALAAALARVYKGQGWSWIMDVLDANAPGWRERK